MSDMLRKGGGIHVHAHVLPRRGEMREVFTVDWD